jgi:hypothetical protein
VTGGQILLSLAGMDGEELFDPVLLGSADKVRALSQSFLSTKRISASDDTKRHPANIAMM